MNPIERRLRIALFVAILLSPAIARAHLTDTGLGPIYDGIAHLLLSFDDLLPVVALALLAGLNGARAGRLVLFILPIAWFAGGIAGVLAAGAAPPAIVTSLSLLALGVLTAASAKLRPALVVFLAVALGLIHGWLNGAAIATAGREANGLIGIAGTIFVVVALGSAVVVSLRKPWTRIAVRVIGSWIAAVGLLVLGWSLRSVLA
ncbi:MAG TPA: HupE/UreJ family protein [Longimicrobiales bacterium]|nr:HupE/UreJ family protein [Longimicrobiales bacterium]